MCIGIDSNGLQFRSIDFVYFAKNFVLRKLILFLFCCLFAIGGYAQNLRELNGKWWAHRSDVTIKGEEISHAGLFLKDWVLATVPGTVLTTQINNRQLPDPFWGDNSKKIPDIVDMGRDFYTWWFVTEFTQRTETGMETWLDFRGVNYAFDLFVNGKKVNEATYIGMFMPRKVNISSLLEANGRNRLAVIVYPPFHPGVPNGGQGGDGTIARDVTNQFVAGWDWMQPIADRNTGIWDKVFIEHTKLADLHNSFITSKVSGVRTVTGRQAPAQLLASAEVTNTGVKPLNGTVSFELNGRTASQRFTVAANTTTKVALPDMVVMEPKLWWPNAVGPQNLYTVKMRLMLDGVGLADEETVTFGIRELSTRWNTRTQSREIYVNGQRIFVKGANWIMTDALLRFSSMRYDAEIRYHRDMNLNMIRVWGGGITERPEFYAACDKYGLLVMQDFWITGDCNGRWYDTYKSDDTNARREYPDDHKLWLQSAAAQIKLLRNHPSLAIWCGGNELPPPSDILHVLQDSLLPILDGTRYFFPYSNHDSMSLQAHDGPYTLQNDLFFWIHKSWGFNSEVGSVGIGDVESIARSIPERNLVQPFYSSDHWVVDSIWKFHKFCSYDSAVEQYGHPATLAEFARKAQLVNFTQYRALMEGTRSRMWNWYTGVLLWKSQNPWPALLGQMYDHDLDANAGFYGLSVGARPLHVMYQPKWGMIMAVNDNPTDTVRVRMWYSLTRGITSIQGVNDSIYVIPPDTCVLLAPAPDIKRQLDKEDSTSGAFLCLRLYAHNSKKILDDNIYWFPGSDSSYNWLNHLKPAALDISVHRVSNTSLKVVLRNRSDVNVSFFNHITLVDKKTHKRVLPVFISDNYLSVLPERYREVYVSCSDAISAAMQVCVDEWNTGKKYVDIH